MNSREVVAAHSSLEEIAAFLGRVRRVLVTAHPSPDGDALGSMTALVLALRQRGLVFFEFNPDPAPKRLHFLAVAQVLQNNLDATPFDATIVLDCSDQRMFENSGVTAAQLGKVIVIDHHQTFGGFGDMVFRETTAAAVGVLVYRLICLLNVSITQPMAEGLYCSIASDTGSFRFPNTNAEAMEIAAKMLTFGASPSSIASQLYDSRPRREIDLLAAVLPTLVISPSGKVAVLSVSPELLIQTGCTSDMTDGFINYARGIEGVEVAILLRPNKDEDAVRVSLRSRGTIDVAEVAAKFGGGGHHNAAGCIVKNTAMAALANQLMNIFEDGT